MRPHATYALRSLVLVLALLAACDRQSIGTPDDDDMARPIGVLGVMEVTISGIGEPGGMSATARPVAGPYGSGGPSFSLTPVSGITLVRESSGSFSRGVRGAGGERYFSATFRVTNGSGGPVSNLTMVPMGDGATIPGTPFTALRRFDGTPADPSLATQIRPTGAAVLNPSLQLTTSGPDVLQVFSEAEVAALVGPAVPNPMPYGFVVRDGLSDTDRTLPPGSSDGLVTVAYRIPLQATVQQDVYTAVFRVVLAQDSETKVTQSLEEQDPAAATAAVARARSLGAPRLLVLPGNDAPVPIPTRAVCAVRVAGTAASPVATLFPTPPSFVSMSPNPYTNAGSFITTTGALSATFDAPATASPSTFVVNGDLLGRRFLGGTYGGSGTTTVTTPAPLFVRGEEVQLSLTGGMGPCEGRVARLRVATLPPAGPYGAPATTPTGSNPGGLAVADLSGDLWRDVITANLDGTLSVLINTGGSSFAPAVHYAVGGSLSDVAVGDLNADGMLDVVATDEEADAVSILTGLGGGALLSSGRKSVGNAPSAVTVGDWNADGALDLAVANHGSPAGISVLFGDGDGDFSPAASYPAFFPSSIAAGDFDNDGRLDLVVGDPAGVTVRLGGGGGSFGAPTAHDTGFPTVDVAVGDLSGDGRSDIAAAISGGGVVVLLATASGFALPMLHFTGSSSSAVAIGDRNGDGLLDLAVANNQNPTPAPGDHVSLLLGTGGGSFAPAVNYPMGNAVFSLAMVDINRDGKLDLAVANALPENTVSVSTAP